MRRVLVTGMGAISPLGDGMNETFTSAVQGRSAIARADASISKYIPDALCAPVNVNLAAKLTREELQLDRSTQLAMLAVQEAVADAALGSTNHDPARIGVYVGAGMAGASALEPLYTKLHARMYGVEAGPPGSVHPLTVPRIMPNAAAAMVSIRGGYRGPTLTYSVACASSAVALGEAFRAIQSDAADIIIVVGTESLLTLGSLAAWHSLRVVAKPDEESLAASCKPFDKFRSGFVLGEGAAAIVLEAEPSARARNSTVHAELSGYGISSDAGHITLPSRDGQVSSLRMALRGARMSPSDIGYINAHGTATAAGDVTETQTIKEVFGAHSKNVVVSSTKSMHGHLIGAAGAMEFAISVRALNAGKIPPTANLKNHDTDCDLDYAPDIGRTKRLHAVMSNSFAFGGTNVSLIAQRYT